MTRRRGQHGVPPPAASIGGKALSASPRGARAGDPPVLARSPCSHGAGSWAGPQPSVQRRRAAGDGEARGQGADSGRHPSRQRSGLFPDFRLHFLQPAIRRHIAARRSRASQAALARQTPGRQGRGKQAVF